MNILRRLSLSRLLLLCVVVVAMGIGATALAVAVVTGPTPPAKPLAEAVHDALVANKPDGVTAHIQLTNHLLEGANLASGDGEASQLSSSPLISGASGRLWVASDGRARLELQSEKGDTQILWDGKTAEMYDAASNMLYRYTPPPPSASTSSQPAGPTAAALATGSSSAGSSGGPGSSSSETGVNGEPATTEHKVPTVTEIEAHVTQARKHADISEPTPTDVAGHAAYTVRIAPRESEGDAAGQGPASGAPLSDNRGLIAGAELSWDAVRGNPLRAAIYSTDSSAPVIELAADEISYGQPERSALEFTPPANAKVENVKLPESSGQHHTGTSGSEKPHVTVHGQGLGAIVLAESPVKPGSDESLPSQLQSLQQVDINGVKASELPTQLGTLLSFERAGVRYLLVGSVTPSAIEAFARSL